MKEKYVRPQIEVLKVENVPLLEVSPNSEDGRNGAGSRSHDCGENFFDEGGAFGSVGWKNDVGSQN